MTSCLILLHTGITKRLPELSKTFSPATTSPGTGTMMVACLEIRQSHVTNAYYLRTKIYYVVQPIPIKDKLQNLYTTIYIKKYCQPMTNKNVRFSLSLGQYNMSPQQSCISHPTANPSTSNSL